jgi:hypothetical protein
VAALSLIVSWVVFPALLAAVGCGWGVLVERAAGRRLGVLVLPAGLAAVIVAASLLTAWSVTAPAATPFVAVVAVVGVILERPWRRVARWPALTAVGVLLCYGAPVLLSGSATFTGYLRLDDTATWFALTDHVLSHGRSFADLPISSYRVLVAEYVTNSYPLGGFMLLGVGHALTGIDVAWIFAPYLACCGAAIGLCVYALAEPVVGSPRLRALVGLLAAQPALLYGYAQWGGIKEMTSAFLLVLGAVLLAQLIVAAPKHPRRCLPLAIAAAALIVTLGAGTAAWVLPAFAGLLLAWVLRAGRKGLWRVARDVGFLTATTALLALPMWVVLQSFLANDSNLYSSGQPVSEKLGNLYAPLSGWQLVGIWPVGDFRLPAPTLATVLLLGLALLAVALALWLTLRQGQIGIATYVAVALVGCAIFDLVGSEPWVIAKALAIAAPALLAAALVGAAMISERSRAGLVLLLAIAAGVLWSNVLAYHDTTLAPRTRLAELQHIDGLLAGKGPTFVNEYEVYADNHFLRDGAPIEPADYRPAILPLSDGVGLTKPAWADIDSFPLSTLEPYRSIVTRRSPAESRPPSIYRLVWQGRYYQLWQRDAQPAWRILEHHPLGESTSLPYCGAAENGEHRPLCSLEPVAVPPCSEIRAIAQRALAAQAQLLAYERPRPILVRGDQSLWPASWIHHPERHELTPTAPGHALSHIVVPRSERYELWLGGRFSRGVEVSVDGASVGRVKDQLAGLSSYVHVADVFLTAGVHTLAITYPGADLSPGSGENTLTSLSAIALSSMQPGELVEVAPREATRLCGRPLDWIEVVQGRRGGSNP